MKWDKWAWLVVAVVGNVVVVAQGWLHHRSADEDVITMAGALVGIGLGAFWYRAYPRSFAYRVAPCAGVLGVGVLLGTVFSLTPWNSGGYAEFTLEPRDVYKVFLLVGLLIGLTVTEAFTNPEFEIVDPARDAPRT